MRRHRVAVLAFEGMTPFELSCVVEVFGLPRPEIDRPWYELSVCGLAAGPFRVVGGFSMIADHGLDTLAAADTVIIPGTPGGVRASVPDELVTALRSAYARGARIVSICSGAFVLAAAGLLDGGRATTHWRYARALAERHPAVEVTPDVLYVDEGRVLTSAGSAAGLDLLLHLVRLDHGAAVANTVARRLVLPPHRDGGQAQFIEVNVRDVADDDGVARAMAWALDNLAEPMTVARLAERARMSQRSFLRHFARQTGTTPIRWLIDRRVQASLPLLEGGDAPVEQVAAAVGFDSPVTFRHHFGRSMRTSPSAYRRAFAAR
ncbi:transcriptional regulator FtrA [Hamadaea tsunoensis]|uniref:transcriptional regulator FtrA n=1 Tax=Hamadaea tsunoensis TaxID=53368 RepID=UPI00040E1676|nr:transcriptional regulator FtrA [Hamadaea tsunoensis]